MRGWPLLLLLVACSSPAAGGWRGTADVGPVAAFELALRFNDDASQGQLKVVEPGRPSTELWFQLCTVRVDRRALLATYDPTSPECQGPKSGHRELRGMIGEQTAWGELWQADKKIGFFRAFREPPAEPTAASTTNP